MTVQKMGQAVESRTGQQQSIKHHNEGRHTANLKRGPAAIGKCQEQEAQAQKDSKEKLT